MGKYQIIICTILLASGLVKATPLGKGRIQAPAFAALNFDSDSENEVDGDCYEEPTDAPVEPTEEVGCYEERTTEPPVEKQETTEVGCYEEPTTPEPKQETTEVGCYEEITEAPVEKVETTEVGCVDDLTEAPVEKEQTTEAVGCEDDAVTQAPRQRSNNQRNHRNKHIAVPQLDGMF